MSPLVKRLPFLALLLALLALGSWAAPAAANTVKITLTVKSAYARATPSFSATPLASVFKDQTYTLLAQDATHTWAQIGIAGAGAAWIPLSYGTVSGDLNSVPVSAESAVVNGPAPTPVPSTGGGSAPVTTGGLRFTLTAKSAYIRSAPDWNGAKIASVFKGQTYTAVARDSSNVWLQVNLGGGGVGWIAASAGQLAGSLSALPYADGSGPGPGGGGITRPTTEPTPNTNVVPSTPPASMPAWIPVITPNMRARYDKAPRTGLSKTAVAMVGDCNFESDWYRELIRQGVGNITGYEYLQTTINRFRPSLMRYSQAVNGGFRSTSVLDPLWADRRVCRAGESPMACELRLNRAGVVFIGLGTGDQFQWEKFESNYRPVVDYALRLGTLPVLVTKADNLEQLEGGAPSGYINDVVRRLGQEYEIPVFDFALVAQTLPNGGLLEEPGNDFHLNADGQGQHIIGILQVLHVLAGP